MGEAEYWKNYTFISDEVNRAIWCFYTFKELNNLQAENNNIHKYFNEAPSYWITQKYALHNSFFIVLGRIFDQDPDTLSIYKIVSETIEHPEYFSKQALAARKSQNVPKPEWLDDYMDGITEPETVELRALKKAIKPYTDKFEAIYRPIRHFVIAHNIATDETKKDELFSKTRIGEVEEILYFLHDLIQNIWQLYYNGRIPTLGSSSPDYKERIKNITRSVFIKILG